MSHNHNTKSVRCSVRSRELHRGRRLLRQLDGDDRHRLVLRLPPVLHPRRLRPLHLRQQEEGCECGRGCVGAGIKHEGPLLGGLPERPLLLLDLSLQRGVVHEVQVADPLAATAAALLHRAAKVSRKLGKHLAVAQDIAARLIHTSQSHHHACNTLLLPIPGLC